VITGNSTFTGAADAAGATGAVGALVAGAVPPGPVAVTVAVRVFPASLETGVYVEAVAPLIDVSFPAH